MNDRPGGSPLVRGERQPGEEGSERNLRPQRLDQFVGQRRLMENLSIYVAASRERGEALDHILFCGPPGLGKTTLAMIIAAELGVDCHVTSGPAIDKKGDLAGILTSLKARDVLFIDEIHRLHPVIEENLYPAIEEFRYDVVIGEGPGARSIKLPLQRFTLIGATTRAGLLTSPLRDRFGIIERLEFYDPAELAAIVHRSAGILGLPVDGEAAGEIARRARGTPRVANRLLRRMRDFAHALGRETIDITVARHGLARMEIDQHGLDRLDMTLLGTVVRKFGGGPVGIDTIAAAIGEDPGTLEDMHEPYLIQQGFLMRTPRGRVATRLAWDHLGLTPPKGTVQGDLFE